MALTVGLNPTWVWRSLLLLAGVFLYRGAILLLASNLRFVVMPGGVETRSRVRRLLWTLYLAGGATAAAGPLLDPRGIAEVFNSGVMSSLVGCLGLGFVPAVFAFQPTPPSAVDNYYVRRNLPLAVLSLIALLCFVLILGPGVRISL